MKSLLLFLFSLYMLLLGYLYFAQRSYIYFPEYTRPASIKPNFEIVNDDLRLKGWVLNQDRKDAIIYFGGNGESVEYNIPQFKQIFPGRAVYLVSYRGYGNSEGEPTEVGLYSDALALYDKIGNSHDKISVIGRSLGGAVATYLAVNRSVDRLALVTPFASLVNLGRRQFPIFPVGLLLKDRYDSIERVRNLDLDTLIIYAENDRIVPVSSTKMLIAEFKPDLVEVKVIQDAGHNTISNFDSYQTKLQAFFEKTD